MKKLLTILILLNTMLLADINWQKDIPTAIKIAKKENKVVMLYVEAENCRWCRKMKEKTLSHKSVDKRVKSFVCVKVFREDKDAIKDLPEVKYAPTVFFLTPQKKIIERVTGYFVVEDFLSYIDDVENYKK